jgi:rhodanese-related sulfurtransferase
MGGRSANASAALEAQGYTQLVDNTQGFGGWTAAKLPTLKGKS